MKHFFKVAVIFLSFLSFGSLTAQNLKLGHINSQELLAGMNSTKEADKKLQDFGRQLEGELKTMSNEYQLKIDDYKNKEASMADVIKQSKVKEIQDLEGRIQMFQQTAQENIQKKKEELYSPILKQVEDAIKAVAKENGYTYVFDTSTGSVLYHPETDNLTALVKKKLDVQEPKPEAPKTNKK